MRFPSWSTKFFSPILSPAPSPSLPFPLLFQRRLSTVGLSPFSPSCSFSSPLLHVVPLCFLSATVPSSFRALSTIHDFFMILSYPYPPPLIHVYPFFSLPFESSCLVPCPLLQPSRLVLPCIVSIFFFLLLPSLAWLIFILQSPSGRDQDEAHLRPSGARHLGNGSESIASIGRGERCE